MKPTQNEFKKSNEITESKWGLLVTVGLLLGKKGNEFQSLGAATIKEGPPR